MPLPIYEIRIYKFEPQVQQQSPQQSNQPAPQQQAQAPFPPQVDQYGNPLNQGGANDDDLPF